MTLRFPIIRYIILLLFLPLPGKAEKKPFNPDLRIGVSGGVNLSKISFHPVIDKEKFAVGYNGGITARWTTERYFGLQGEVNYSVRGWIREFIQQKHIDGGYEYSRGINYIEVPLMTHVYFGNNVRGFINIGPKISFYLNENEHCNFRDDLKENVIDSISAYRFFAEVGRPVQKKIDWGICGGGGLEVRTRTGSYIVEARYYFGLGNIFDSAVGLNENGQIKNPFDRSAFSNISVNVVYLIPIFGNKKQRMNK